MVEVTQNQNSINDSVKWSIIWDMLFDFKKCKHMHMGYHDTDHTYTKKKGQDSIPIEKRTERKIWES